MEQEALRRAQEALGLPCTIANGNEVYAIDREEDCCIRIGFVSEVAVMLPETIRYEYEAELTAQEENEAEGWA